MSRKDGLMRSNTAPPVEKSPSGGDDVDGRISSPLAPSFGRVYDHEDDHNQPAKKSVLARVREKARKWRQTLLKKRHGADGANATPAWGVTLEEDDDDDEFHGAPMYESELGNDEYKDTHNRNPFSPPAAASNNHGNKDMPTTRNSLSSSVTTAEKYEDKTEATENPSHMPDASTEKHEYREKQIGNSSSPPHQVTSEKNEYKDTSVKNPSPATLSATEDNEYKTPQITPEPRFIAQKVGRKDKPITSLTAVTTEKHGFQDAPVRNSSPMPADATKEHQYKDLPFIHPSTLPAARATEEEHHECEGTLNRKSSPTPAGSTEEKECRDAKITTPSAPPAALAEKNVTANTVTSEESATTKDVPVDKVDINNNTSNKTLTEMVADKLQPVYNMVSEATQNVAMKFQGERAAAEASGRPRLEKSVSVKEYLMQKFEPGAEERALSRVISDVISPRHVGEKRELGVVGKMKEAVTSFLGMEEESKSSAPAASTNATTQTQKILQCEEIPGRRIQTEETMERRLQAN